MKRLGLVMLLLALAPAAITRPAVASTRGLVVGINKYAIYPDLEGAVSDARDIALVLRRIGARSVTMLIDEQATYGRIKATWMNMVRRARRGDTLVFSYSGHGSQEPEQVAGSEADGKDEVFVLSAFDPNTASPDGARHRIVDNEINSWFRDAGRKGLRVIFIADSCHSGTMLRRRDKRVKVTTRSIPPYGDPLDSELVSAEIATGAELQLDDMPHVTFLAATREHLTVQEVAIDGRKRGALSWAFARALERGADRNGDGYVSRFELEGFITPTVRQISEARQVPEVLPRSGETDARLFRSAGQQTQESEIELRIEVRNLEERRARALIGALAGVRLVGENEVPDLIWDAEDRTVLSSAGDVLASNVKGPVLQSVVDKWRTLAALKRLARGRPLDMKLSPDDSRHPDGAAIAFLSDPLQHAHVTAFNLAPNGDVNFLYPFADDLAKLPKWPAGERYRLDLGVSAPFGSDHLIVIASASPLTTLQQQLRQARAIEVPRLIEAAVKGIAHQIGIQGLYTYAGERTQ